MDTTIFLAQFWGWLLVIMSVIYTIKGNSFWDDMFKMHENRGVVFLSGWLALPLGLFTVILHNVWVADWRIIITILGWITLIKGIVRSGFPNVIQKITPWFYNKYIFLRVALIVMGLLGVWLIRMSL